MIVPRKEYRAFLSSTAKGYSETRNDIASAFDRMEGFKLIRYENFSASPEDAIEKCLSEIECADLLLLICGPFIGTLGSDGISIVEREYRQALEKRKDCLVFVASDDFKIRSGDVENDRQRKKLRQFKSRLDSTHYRDSFTNVVELIQKMTSAASNWRIKKEEPKGFLPTKVIDRRNISFDKVGLGNICWKENKNTNQLEITASDGPIILRGIRLEQDGQSKEYYFQSKLPKGTCFYRASGASIIDSKGNIQKIAADVPRFTENGLLLEPQRTNYAPPVVDGRVLPYMTQTSGSGRLLDNEDLIASIIGSDCKIKRYRTDANAGSSEHKKLKFIDECIIKDGDSIRFEAEKDSLYWFLFLSEEGTVHVQLETGKFPTSPISTIKTDKDYFIKVTRAPDILLIDT